MQAALVDKGDVGAVDGERIVHRSVFRVNVDDDHFLLSAGGEDFGAVDKRASKDHRLFRVSFLRKRKRPYCGLYQSY